VVDTSEPAVNLAISTTFRLTLVVVVASDIGEKIRRPAEKLLPKGVDEGSDWGFLGQFVQFVNEFSNAAGVLLAGLGDENHITLHVSSGLVVLTMRNLPGEVWDEESRMADPASGVVEDLGRRERLVTALVSKNPKTSTKQTLNNGVYSPKPSTDWGRRDVFWSNEFIEDHEGDCKTGDVPSNIAQSPQPRSLKAVLGNCVSNIIDCVVRKRELVSVCINKFAITLLFHIVQRRHRRQRSAGW
jgi:hypothetical protein